MQATATTTDQLDADTDTMEPNRASPLKLLDEGIASGRQKIAGIMATINETLEEIMYEELECEDVEEGEEEVVAVAAAVEGERGNQGELGETEAKGEEEGEKQGKPDPELAPHADGRAAGAPSLALGEVLAKQKGLRGTGVDRTDTSSHVHMNRSGGATDTAVQQRPWAAMYDSKAAQNQCLY